MTAATAQHNTPSRSIHPWLVGALTAAAFALRLIRLGADSLWYDETVSVFLAGKSVPDLIAHTARDIHPPGYYLLLRGWLALTGFPIGHADPTGYRLEFAAAFLSLLFGVLLVPLTWQLARRLRLGDATATVAALLIAASPFGVWYSQEVRMYTLGATLGVLCLLVTTSFLFDDGQPGRLGRAAVVFAIAAAAGLYTLYYFAFLLVSLSLLTVPLLLWRWRTNGQAARRRLAIWLLAQLGALLLFAPWLRTAWRQATDPPVPPWRTAPQLLSALVESWGALSFGQSADVARFGPLLALTLGLVALGSVAAWRGLPGGQSRSQPGAAGRRPQSRTALALLLAAAFGPLALILLASVQTPLYHVRYLFTYAPALSVLLALGIVALSRWRPALLGRWLAATAVVLILAGSALALRAFWTDLALRPDDHRAAVRGLADRWRPGDAILVNAGYAYPALLTYWSGPPLAWLGRLSDFDRTVVEQAGDLPVVVQTGHVDGDPDLGWGDPRSDFYALSSHEMQRKLAELSLASDRIWHYRIYDTVNDPAGSLRAALGSSGTLVDDQVYPGEANLRVQLWQTVRHLLSSYTPPPLATFDGWLTLGLASEAGPEAVSAGQSLEIADVRWTRPPALAGQDVATSLRLVDDRGEVWAAHDERLGGNQLDLIGATSLVQPLHLAIPAGTPPLTYDLVLVVYDPLTGEPLPVVPGASRDLVLGQVAVRPSSQPETAQRPLADFGPLQLVEASSPASVVSPGDEIPVELVWQAGADTATESLVAVLQLVDGANNVAASLEEEPLQGRYAANQWAGGELVRDRHRLSVPEGAPAGVYRLIVGVYRASDRERLPARSGLASLRSSDHAVIQSIEIR